MMKIIYLSNTTLTLKYKTDKKTYNNSDMDHIKFLICVTLNMRSKITKHTLTVVIIILPVVIHIDSMAISFIGLVSHHSTVFTQNRYDH